MTSSDALRRRANGLRRLAGRPGKPLADELIWAADRIDQQAEEVERLRAVLLDMGFMSANKAPSPGDTHVETFMPVDAWKEFRP
jgi:hypothetical protein